MLVTGGANGIGRQIAEEFLREGASVVIADLVEPQGMEHSSCRFVSCNAAVPNEIEECCKLAAPIDILVNNVCVQLEAPCHEHSLEDWNKTLAIGLTSYFLFSKLCLPYMLEKSCGVIVNISSVQGTQSQPGIPAYAAVKGGVLSLTRQLAVEYAPKGIRVNSVSPGTIATPLVEGVLQRAGTSREAAGRAYPLRRIGEPSEVAKVVLFLASDDASFVTAENVTVDGGIMGLGGWASFS